MEYYTRALFLCVGCVLLGASLAAQNGIFAPANEVSFSISTDHIIHAKQKQLTVSYRIENISNALLFVPKDQGDAACRGGAPIVHVVAWFENAAGKDFCNGLFSGCAGGGEPFAVGMGEASALLRPGEQFDGTITVAPGLLNLPPGAYRIKATLDGWKDDQFTQAQRTELSTMGHPFLRGEVLASAQITLTR